jgi:hypothetical protein
MKGRDAGGAIIDSYRIVAERDLAEGLAKLAADGRTTPRPKDAGLSR